MSQSHCVFAIQEGSHDSIAGHSTCGWIQVQHRCCTCNSQGHCDCFLQVAMCISFLRVQELCHGWTCNHKVSLRLPLQACRIIAITLTNHGELLCDLFLHIVVDFSHLHFTGCTETLQPHSQITVVHQSWVIKCTNHIVIALECAHWASPEPLS